MSASAQRARDVHARQHEVDKLQGQILIDWASHALQIQKATVEQVIVVILRLF